MPRSFDLSCCSTADGGGGGGNRVTLPRAPNVLSSSEHVKSQHFNRLTQSIVWAQLFVFALGPHNPLGGPE